MSTQDPIRLLPRNVAARRRLGQPAAAVEIVAGNPASTRLESGVGNCFPGLECDLRNLERRFFPFLEVDDRDDTLEIVAVSSDAVRAARQAGDITADTARAYEQIAAAITPRSRPAIVSIDGVFGPLGAQVVDLTASRRQSIGRTRAPIDNWTAVRLLTEGTLVKLTVQVGRSTVEITGTRVRYLGDDGALADFFRPGELTQSLCSPWTHDFRDCGCFYWASNHPDIAQPPSPVVPSDDVAWNQLVVWERRARDASQPPGAESLAQAVGTPELEMRHHEINRRWQEFNFVVEGREQLGPYAPRRPVGTPLPDRAALIAHLQYAAAVELAVMHEYLAAAFSLPRPGTLSGLLGDDADAAHAEILRVAIGEMRHLRAVNDVLRSLQGSAYAPALRVALQVPGQTPGSTRPVEVRPATPEAIDSFIAVEAPSVSVDGYYTAILATLEAQGARAEAETIRTVMSEGADHWQSFLFVKQWLSRHSPDSYLAVSSLAQAPRNLPAQLTLQQRYGQLLTDLYDGYRLGLPQGAASINAARSLMPDEATGFAAAAWAVAAAGFLVRFDPIVDPRFAAFDPPP
ncbi:MAG: hypothetical protein JSR73_08440 [Proteobacteria bacterium]|nr:hypothetical protein [Pseudomonadota bacterium]